MHLYNIDGFDRLISGPHTVPSKGAVTPKGSVITNNSPPQPGEGEVIFHKGRGEWEARPDVELVSTPDTPSTDPIIIDRGQFRLLFTFLERQAEETYHHKAIKLVQGDAPVLSIPPSQSEYDAVVEYKQAQSNLTMRTDFDAASHINLSDKAVEAALEFYVAVGILEESRVAEILSNSPPDAPE